MNIPGETSSVVTCIDGYEMARKGRAGAALGIAAMGSFVASTFGILGVMLLAPPAQPCAWAWQALGLSLREMVVVQAGGPGRGGQGDLLWALEHALRSGHLGAVLAWLPAQLPVDALRRLQLAAQPHDGPAFLLRGSAAAGQFSPATLRCLLEPAGHDSLQLHLLKRRGPPREAPLSLALPPVLAASARVRTRDMPALPSAARQAPARLARLARL